MLKKWLQAGFALLLAGCSVVSPLPAPDAAPVDAGAGTAARPAEPQEAVVVEDAMKPYYSDLKDYGEAPGLNNDVWLNVAEPLKLADLRGKVVLLEMWTFGCINCQHVIPSLRSWYDTYGDQGLVIIGNHFPEFSYEADLGHLKDAIKRLDVRYPVTQDNDGATWRAYDNHYWPSLFLIDKQGHIRYKHIGEGRYQETEEAIQDLLAETYP